MQAALRTHRPIDGVSLDAGADANGCLSRLGGRREMSQIAEWLNAWVSSTHSTIGGMILLCCAISHYVARQVKNHARLYTVLALFTGA